MEHAYYGFVCMYVKYLSTAVYTLLLHHTFDVLRSFKYLIFHLLWEDLLNWYH